VPSPLSGLGTDMPDERVEFAAGGADRPELKLPGTGEDFRRLMSHAAKARSEAAARSPASASSAFLAEKATDVPVAALRACRESTRWFDLDFVRVEEPSDVVWLAETGC
jgi:hypothetical protein